jgi:hypothetical protein
MLLTIGIILVATVALATLEIWLIWLAGERVDRLRAYRRDRTAVRGWNRPVTLHQSRPPRWRRRQRSARWISQND